jgi:hypothetical protein
MSARGWMVTVLAGIMACGGTTEPPGPQAGTVIAALHSPNGQDGALVVRIIGDQTALKASGSYRMDTGTQIPGTTTRVIISGQIADGDLLEFHVTDISKVATYVVTVEQAAARNTYALLDPSGYNITLRVK